VPDMMTTREVADYLRVKERKIYDLISREQIPCSRVSGKWLFPKALIDRWILQNARGGPVRHEPAPPVIAGNHDPLLEWAVRESGSALAFLAGGSLDGLQRVARREAALCGTHMRDAETGDYTIAWVERVLAGQDVVVVAWAKRAQGLVVAPGNPLDIADVTQLADGPRVVRRQEGAGSRLLLDQLLVDANVAEDAVTYADDVARTEADLAAMVADGKADAGVAIGAAASMFRLDFVPLHEERFHLVVDRHAYFEPPFQSLLKFTGSPAFAARAGELGGYDISAVGSVVWNAV